MEGAAGQAIYPHPCGCFVSTTGSMTDGPACAMLTLQAQPQDRREKGEEHMTERFEAENPEDGREADDSDFMTEAELAHIEGFWIDDDGNWIPEDEEDDWYD